MSTLFAIICVSIVLATQSVAHGAALKKMQPTKTLATPKVMQPYKTKEMTIISAPGMLPPKVLPATPSVRIGPGNDFGAMTHFTVTLIDREIVSPSVFENTGRVSLDSYTDQGLTYYPGLSGLLYRIPGVNGITILDTNILGISMLKIFFDVTEVSNRVAAVLNKYFAGQRVFDIGDPLFAWPKEVEFRMEQFIDTNFKDEHMRYTFNHRIANMPHIYSFLERPGIDAPGFDVSMYTDHAYAIKITIRKHCTFETKKIVYQAVQAAIEAEREQLRREQSK